MPLIVVRSAQSELLERRRQVKPSNRSNAPPKSPNPSRSQSHCAHIQIRAHREDNSVRKIDAFCRCMKKDTHTCSTLLSALLCIKPSALSPFLRRLMLHKQPPGYASHHITSHRITGNHKQNTNKTHPLSPPHRPYDVRPPDNPRPPPSAARPRDLFSALYSCHSCRFLLLLLLRGWGR